MDVHRLVQGTRNVIICSGVDRRSPKSCDRMVGADRATRIPVKANPSISLGVSKANPQC